MMPGASAPLVQLRAMVGPANLLIEPHDQAPYLTDHRRLYHGRALAIVLPRDAQEVARVLQFANALRIGVVPCGGNTSYCGGATPDESGTQIVIALRRLDRLRSVDPANYALTAEAGCVLANVQRAAAEAGRFFPLSLGAQGSCQIGGNLATNAGGTNVLRYGTARDLVLGLEVALADGRLLSTLGTLRKDNTGYDLNSLFVGSEGTLGIITAATLKLFPPQASTATAFIAVPNVAAAVALLAELRHRSGDLVSSFELVPRIAVDLVTRHIPGVAIPLPAPNDWYVLCELASTAIEPGLVESLAQMLSAPGVTELACEAIVARNEREREQMWKLRESIPEAQRLEGASLKHDIALPVATLPQFVAEAAALVASQAPEAVLVCYGHLGDGNLHFNVNQQAGAAAAALTRHEPDMRRAIHDLVRRYGGSFSAEHGIGQLKVGELERYASVTELELMKSIKRAFDPNGIMNPGKVLRMS